MSQNSYRRLSRPLLVIGCVYVTLIQLPNCVQAGRTFDQEKLGRGEVGSLEENNYEFGAWSPVGKDNTFEKALELKANQVESKAEEVPSKTKAKSFGPIKLSEAETQRITYVGQTPQAVSRKLDDSDQKNLDEGQLLEQEILEKHGVKFSQPSSESTDIPDVVYARRRPKIKRRPRYRPGSSAASS
eukprot:TCALIF_09149-PA protein Name:"Protein of unknown function" AED:0.26 eAED:0.26 QI:230/0.5/0.33/0.66/0/0.33/3/0/185